MTRKTRRSKSSEDDSRDRSGTSSKAEPDTGGQTNPETHDEKPSKPAEKKISLPAFGFATDLLKKPTEAAETAPTPDEATANQGKADDAIAEATPTGEAEPAELEIDQHDPGRIFAFADSLDRNTAELEENSAPVKLETWVAFGLANETFALPVSPVREVVRVASITRVPHAPKPIRGVTNMRGRVIPVIDLRLRIDLPETELARSSRVIVVNSRGRLLGLLVDSVHQVIHVDVSRVQPPPDDVMTVQSDYLCGVYHHGDQLVLLLDIDRALIIHEAPPPAADGPAETSQSHAAEEQPQA